MKQFITDRHQIAQALNFGTFPVIFTDISKAQDNYGWKIANIRLDRGVEFEKKAGYRFEDGYIYIYNDNFQLTVSRKPVIITSDFSSRDVFEMATRANVPAIPMKEGQEVVFVFKNITGTAMVLKMKIESVNNEICCSTPFRFEDANMKAVLEELGENTSEEAINKMRGF